MCFQWFLMKWTFKDDKKIHYIIDFSVKLKFYYLTCKNCLKLQVF